MHNPELGYGSAGRRNSGWSGSDTSRERAERQDADGTTGQRQRLVIEFAREVGLRGVTDPEIQKMLGVGHGSSSSALTNLHKAGRLARLTARRRRNAIYVLPQYVDGRETAAYRPNSGKTITREQAMTGARVLAETSLGSRLNDSGWERVQNVWYRRFVAGLDAIGIVVTETKR